MRQIVLFFNGVKQSFKKSWFAILILMITCIIGVIGVGFCYRTAVFNMRQPDQKSNYDGQDVYSYVFDKEKLDISKIKEIPNCLGMNAIISLKIGDTSEEICVFTKDVYLENLIDFNSSNGQIVVNENISLNKGDFVEVNGKKMLVVGKTQKTSYVNANAMQEIVGRATFYFKNQLSKGQMTKLEKNVGAKLLRDSNWNGVFTTKEVVFVVLAVIIALLVAINIFRLFNLYRRLNGSRYKLYRMMGMSNTKVNSIVFCELFLIFILSLPIALLIDGFALRPLSTLIQVTYMYDFLDIFVISACVLIPFVFVFLIQVLTEKFKTANGNKKVRGQKNAK